jgi:anthranilate synthase component 1
VTQLQRSFRAPHLEQLPVFSGGLVGYLGYEIVQRFEQRLANDEKPDELGTPDMVLLLSEEVAVFDNLAGRLYLISNIDPAAPDAWATAQRRLDKLAHRLRTTVSAAGISSRPSTAARSTSCPATFSRSCCRSG